MRDRGSAGVLRYELRLQKDGYRTERQRSPDPAKNRFAPVAQCRREKVPSVFGPESVRARGGILSQAPITQQLPISTLRWEAKPSNLPKWARGRLLGAADAHGTSFGHPHAPFTE